MSYWKLGLIILGIGIILLSFLYNNWLIKKLTNEEYMKMKHLSLAFQELNKSDINADIKFPQDIIIDNNTIPAIITDAFGDIQTFINIDTIGKSATQVDKLLHISLEEMKNSHPSIKIELAFDTLIQADSDTMNYQLLYYSDSTILRQLRRYPFIQAFVLGVFFLLCLLAFAAAKNAEQNRVWVGMSKETAHQLGTPISSLMAWVEILKVRMRETPEDLQLIKELETDVQRLEMVAERFSKIGASPQLTPQPIYNSIAKTVQYMKRRCPRGVILYDDVSDKMYPIIVSYNAPLFDWVIENLLKNALDAIEGGKGEIHINMYDLRKEINIDISDTGHGIPPNKIKRIFNPGYTTKKRGWGLGLSLCKRIIENYHQGKIYVKESEIGKGTTFSIILKK